MGLKPIAECVDEVVDIFRYANPDCNKSIVLNELIQDYQKYRRKLENYCCFIDLEFSSPDLKKSFVAKCDLIVDDIIHYYSKSEKRLIQKRFDDSQMKIIYRYKEVPGCAHPNLVAIWFSYMYKNFYYSFDDYRKAGGRWY